MQTKYTKIKRDFNTGQIIEYIYPDCPDIIKSKEDLIRWFEHRGQVVDNGRKINDRRHLIKRLPEKFIEESSETEIKIMFPNCKFIASAIFISGEYKNECCRISV